MATRKAETKRGPASVGRATPGKTQARTRTADRMGEGQGAASKLKKATKRAKRDDKRKVVRDSFTMPQDEYLKIAEIKALCLKSGMHVKKSEVLRAGLKNLVKLSASQLKRSLNDLEKIKTGRPKKH